MKFERYGIGIAKGLTVTMRNLLRRRITTQYPEQRLTVSRRTRGNELVWSKEKCTGCATCAKTCPQGVIHIVTSPGEENSYEVEEFEVDTGYCISCGLCVEACPYDALYMSYAFELARYRRGELVLSRNDMLIENKQASAYFRPEISETLPEQELLIDRKE
ncbi:MAG: NADH-quinone oxidoreductase subunit I [Dehalococcoidales bacterium]|nr:MAG: NADH-quinone oxidoreductase subunit I [Dehalococcoidales bacterium]